MTSVEAENLVDKYLAKSVAGYGIYPNSTIEFDLCFVVFYQNLKYIETKAFEDMWVGHGGILVEKATGKIFMTGSAHSCEFYVENFEACGHPYGSPTTLLRLYGAREGAEKTSAIKALRKVNREGLGRLKSQIDSVLAGESVEVETESIELARTTAILLAKLGFDVEQVWDIPLT